MSITGTTATAISAPVDHSVYRLCSSGLVFAPGIVRTAVDTYKANPKVSVNLLAEGWGLPRDVAEKVCRRKLPFTIEGETVVISTKDQ